ncbi:MAG: 30S ribosomal protein S16 [Candidatus Omnitrophota bacterium]
MLRIRLMKPGKPIKGRHHWKIVVIDGHSPRDSRFLEQIGYYNPGCDMLKMDLERYDVWVKKGAKPTETVVSLSKRVKKSLKNAGQ